MFKLKTNTLDGACAGAKGLPYRRECRVGNLHASSQLPDPMRLKRSKRHTMVAFSVSSVLPAADIALNMDLWTCFLRA